LKEERQKGKEALESDGGRTKRGAASRAASKLKSDMEDRNQFEKEIKHGQLWALGRGRGRYISVDVTQNLDEVLDRRPPKKRKSMPESVEDSVVEGSVILGGVSLGGGRNCLLTAATERIQGYGLSPLLQIWTTSR
jgi:hypothetical protein